MINNNLDYEKNCNTTSGVTTPTGTAMRTKMKMKITASETAANNVNNSNDNSYFNRFDNRIAANLAAVINGARFRSSSCSKTSATTIAKASAMATTTTTANVTPTKPSHNIKANMRNINTNLNISTATIRLNANNVISNSYTNLHLHNGGSSSRSNSNSMDRRPLHHYHQGLAPSNNVGTDGTGSGLSHGIGRSRPSSPLFLSNHIGDGGTPPMGRRRPLHLFSQVNLNCNDNEKVTQTPSSDEDNSPTELNNCKRLTDKPPLVKRLTMGLLRSNEESRPLVNNATPTSTANVNTTNSPLKPSFLTIGGGSKAIYSNGYINEEAFEPEKFIASKFGDSCRQSLTAIPMLDSVNFNDNSEFNLKKRYLRETSSANSSPKIFANRLRANAAATTNHYSSTATTNLPPTNCPGYPNYNNINSGLAFNAADDDADADDEIELKDAGWFQAGISREIAIEVLAAKSPGAFLVRKSSSKPGCYALTLRVPSPPGPKIANYIILRTARGYKIKGFRKEFSSLKALITHHSVMPELLPVPLAMPRPTNMTSSRRNLDDFDTYDSLQMLLKYLRAKNLESGD